jgi:regulator of protease activity HflC (stomatin/prohibitin superfamily)
MSLAFKNTQSSTITVNDKLGSPIEIGVNIVWKVNDTYRAMFDVGDFTSFVDTQTESAVRTIAAMFPYDTFDKHDNEALTLRASKDEINIILEKELTDRFHRAGIEVIEARISQLSYAPQIVG